MQGEKIAVLLSAYNGEKYIKEQIDSIFNQNNAENITLFIRNDGSTDRTLGIIEEIKKTKNSIEIINEENVGLVASFFKLLKYAYGKEFDYFSFCDQDDYWLPEKLSVAIEAIKQYSYPCMYSSCSIITDEKLRPCGGNTQIKKREITFFNSAIQNFCPGHNQVINRKMADIVLKHTRYSKKIYSQDMWITTIASVTGTVVFNNTPYVLYRQHNNNQLSFGKNRLDWFIDHIQRLKKDEGKKIAIQLKYFCHCYSIFLTSEQKKEMHSFFSSQDTFISRLRYILKTKIYRQKRVETAIFKMLYLMGKYNV